MKWIDNAFIDKLCFFHDTIFVDKLQDIIDFCKFFMQNKAGTNEKCLSSVPASMFYFSERVKASFI